MFTTTSPNAAERKRGWSIVLGLLLVVIGLIAIAFPLASSVAVEAIVAASLLIAGLGQAAHALANRNAEGSIIALIVGAAWLLAGAILLTHPLGGIAVLTLVTAAAFVAEGIARVFYALRMTSDGGWGWILTGGTVAIIVGFLLWIQFPLSAAWALGALTGVNIFFSGMMVIMLGLASPASGAPEAPEPATS